MKIILIGAEGRMGKCVTSLATNHIITPIGSPNSSLPHDITPFFKDHDLVLDFSTPNALSENLPKVVAAKKPYVIGITGLTKENFKEVAKAAIHIPIFISSNFSEGIALLKKLIKHLPAGNYEITEIHHSAKKDAPSGTAIDLSNHLPSDTNITSFREGSTIGIHTISLHLPFETLELKHEVTDRKVFAKGALLACSFLSNKAAGLYTSIYD